MPTDPHVYKGTHNNLRISPTADPEVIEVEMFNRSERRGLWNDVPVAVIRSMLDASAPAGSYTRTDEEVRSDSTAVALAAAVVRADKAEQELADLRRRYSEQGDRLVASYASQPRGFTAEDVDDEMIERGARQYIEEDYTSWERSPALAKNNARESVRGILEAALTPPPPRPEGAEEIHQVLDAIYRDEPGITHRGNLADVLASHGVRVTGADS